MKPIYWSCLGAVCVLATACGPSAGGDPDADGGAHGTPDAGVPVEMRTLTGIAEDVYWTPDGTKTTAPADVTRTFVEAQVPNAQGGWDRFPGLANADGTYSIDVPKSTGSYWLRVYDVANLIDTYIWANGDAPDLSRDHFGRAGQLVCHDRQTTVTFHVDGLDTWQDFDELEMSSPTVGLSAGMVPTFYATNMPANGDTKLDGLQLTWSQFPMLSEENGDSLQFVQLHSVMDSTNRISYMAPVKTATLTNLTLTLGANNDATGAFTDPPEFDYALNWKRTAFAELAGDVYPGLTGATFTSFFVRAIPGGVSHGELYPNEMRLIGNAFVPQDGTDVSEVLSTRNPYPESWLVNGFNSNFQIPVDLEPGIGTTFDANIGYVSPELTTAEKPALPMISPARDLKIGDTSAVGQPISGVDPDPELSWTAPKLGSATSWELTLSRAQIIRDPGLPGRPAQVHVNMTDVARLVVPGDVTHLKLPPELLVSDVSYVVHLRAVHQEGQDVAQAPFKQSLPSGWADTYSTFFTIR